MNLGPGAYHQGRSDFSKTLATKGISESGSYLLNDNGHINQRTQPYISLSKAHRPSSDNLMDKPGPGQYEALASDF